MPSLAELSAADSDKPADQAVTVTIQSLLDERHTARESTLHQPAGSGQWAGDFRGARRGHGTDFDDLRHYSLGDEIRHIDWKASARTNALHTRLYREEREHRVTLITDLRHSMFTGTRALRSAKACHLSARVLWQAIEGGSRVCLIAICDAGLAVSKNGSGHHAAIDACALLAKHFQAQKTSTNIPLGTLITSPVSPSPSADSSMSLEQVANWTSTQRLRHGSVIWVSAFDHVGRHFNESMNSLSQAARQVAIHVDDEMLDKGLPAGLYGYRTGSPSDNRINRSATLGRQHVKQLKQQLWQQKQQRIERFSELVIPLLHSSTGDTEIIATLRQSGHLP